MTLTPDVTPRRHAYTGPDVLQLPEPSYAERVRTLVMLTSIATLATMSRKCPGYPFGSLMPYALDLEGRPVFLISNMAMHTQNLKAEPKASLFVGQIADGDPLGAARATVVGDVEPIPAADLASAREFYLARHENSRSWVDFEDFGFYRLQPLDIYYVGGFGVMGWVSAEDYRQARADPLAEAAPGIIAHMNADHVPAMILLAHAHGGYEATEAAMTAVDRLGFFLRLKTAEGMKGVRINFLREVASAIETRTMLVEMVRAAEAGS
jgi:putative heme iron utilization protein